MKSGAAFARPFVEDEAALKKLDERVLRRSQNGVARGKWCSGLIGGEDDPCSSWGNVDEVEAGKWGKRFKSLVERIVSDERLALEQCKF